MAGELLKVLNVQSFVAMQWGAITDCFERRENICKKKWPLLYWKKVISEISAFAYIPQNIFVHEYFIVAVRYPHLNQVFFTELTMSFLTYSTGICYKAYTHIWQCELECNTESFIVKNIINIMHDLPQIMNGVPTCPSKLSTSLHLRQFSQCSTLERWVIFQAFFFFFFFALCMSTLYTSLRMYMQNDLFSSAPSLLNPWWEIVIVKERAE